MTTAERGAAHTPTPWRATPYSGIVGVAVMGDRTTIVATLPGLPAEAKANAALIVRAVNSHAALSQRNEELRNALAECADRFERCCIHAGSDREGAAGAVSVYRRLLSKVTA